MEEGGNNKRAWADQANGWRPASRNDDTRQFYFVNEKLNAVAARFGNTEDLDDDSLQVMFNADPAYVQTWSDETKLLYAAARAPSDGEARDLAGQALAKMRLRRRTWFVGARAKWAPIDDLFLQMEGLGQWLIYKWYVDGPHDTISPDVAIRAVRRSRKRWSQEEGFALMLVVDRLIPDWRRRAFGPAPALAEELLSTAARAR